MFQFARRDNELGRDHSLDRIKKCLDLFVAQETIFCLQNQTRVTLLAVKLTRHLAVFRRGGSIVALRNFEFRRSVMNRQSFLRCAGRIDPFQLLGEKINELLGEVRNVFRRIGFPVHLSQHQGPAPLFVAIDRQIKFHREVIDRYRVFAHEFRGQCPVRDLFGNLGRRFVSGGLFNTEQKLEQYA